MRTTRAILAAEAPDAATRIVDNFRKTISLQPNASIAGYWPFRDELDVRPLLTALAGRGHVIALPRVLGSRKPLQFHKWRREDPLVVSVFGVMEPKAITAIITPIVILVPLLAFDREGYRLGYGAGYYDMTLAALRRERPVNVVGIGYAGQEVDRLPREPHDQRMDWIVTEKAARRMEG